MDAIFLLEPSYNGTDYVATATSLGIRPVVVRRDDGPENPAPEQSDEIIVNTADIDALAASCQAWIESHRPTRIGVLAGYELAVPAAAALSRRLGVLGNSSESALAAREKWPMRQALKAGGVRCPASNRYDDIRSVLEAVREEDYPVVLKPVDMACSMYVKLVDTRAELELHAGEIFAAEKNFDKSTQTRKQLLVEQFVEGPEFSVEQFLSEGVAIFSSVTEKHKGLLPYFVETGHVVPSSITDAAQDCLLVETAAMAARALGLTSGPCHVEIVLTERGPSVIELAARLGGDQITRLLRLARGVDLHRAAVRQAMGEPVTAAELQAKQGSAAIRFLHPESHAEEAEGASPTPLPEEGRFFQIEGAAEAAQGHHILEVVIYPRFPVAGALIKPLTSSLDRVGHVIALAPTSQEANESARQAARAIRFRPI